MALKAVSRGQYIGHLFIALLLSSLIILGLSKFAVDLAGSYGQNSTNLQSLSKANETIESINTLKTTMETTPYSNIPLIGGGLTIISGVDAVLKTITSFFANYTSFISGMVASLGIPTWVGDIAKGVVLLIFVFGILSAVLKWRL